MQLSPPHFHVPLAANKVPVLILKTEHKRGKYFTGQSSVTCVSCDELDPAAVATAARKAAAATVLVCLSLELKSYYSYLGGVSVEMRISRRRRALVEYFFCVPGKVCTWRTGGRCFCFVALECPSFA